MTKFFSGFLICASLSIIMILFLQPEPISLENNSSHKRRLENLWHKDFEALRLGGHLHPGFDNLKEYQFIPSTEESTDWIKDLSLPFEIKPEGTFSVEILVLDWSEEGQKGVILQHNLTDLATKNLVYEIGRTYFLEGSLEETEKLLNTSEPTEEPTADSKKSKKE